MFYNVNTITINVINLLFYSAFQVIILRFFAKFLLNAATEDQSSTTGKFASAATVDQSEPFSFLIGQPEAGQGKTEQLESSVGGEEPMRGGGLR